MRFQLLAGSHESGVCVTVVSGFLIFHCNDHSCFGSFNELKEKFAKGAISIQGSGWAWLVYNHTYARLEFTTTQNQTSPLTQRLIPLLGLDVWEHAYYLKYQNRRVDYVSAWWNVVNWSEVEERFLRITR